MICRLLFLLALLGGSLFSPAGARGEGKVFTLWPAVDYRQSAETDYASLHLLGPLFKYERKGSEREIALRPLFFHAWDGEGNAFSEYLYPVGSRKRSGGASSGRGLGLLQSDFGPREMGSDNEFMLFPLLFYGENKEKGNYFALFPLGGKIYDMFGRDEIRFALFPLYGRTQKKETTTTNLLYPVFARITGENETGTKVWPLYGASAKEGVYRKRFFLWPIFFADDLRLDTENPERRRAAFPFYVALDSTRSSSRTILWPFFSRHEDRVRNYVEWNFPWPLQRISRGDGREGERFLPFFSDERSGSNRRRWFLWPIYKIEELHTEQIDRRRDRLLYFLFSRLEERQEGAAATKRVAFWPLFTWEEANGVSHFHTLSLLEPFFPGKEGIERNWAPLWRLYQVKSDRQGNEISSLLWNLYWKERRGSDLAMEVFPLFSYEREAEARDLRILKGMVRYRRGEEGKKVNLFFLPWPLRWGGAPETGGDNNG